MRECVEALKERVKVVEEEKEKTEQKLSISEEEKKKLGVVVEEM